MPLTVKNLLKRQNYFNEAGHYFDYTITRYKGIDCQHLIIVREALHQLRRCVDLDPEFHEAKKELSEFLDEIKKKWMELKHKEIIDSETHQNYLLKLDCFSSEDPFKWDFLNNSYLFKFVINASSSFKEKYPSYLTHEKFLAKYPDAEFKPIGLLDSNYNQMPDAKIDQLNAEINEAYVALEKNKNDIKLMAQVIKSSLGLASISSQKAKDSWLNYAIETSQSMKKNYFNSLSHYYDYVIGRFKQIDCNNLPLVREVLNQLKRSIELDPTFEGAKKDLEQLPQEIKAAWKELESAGAIDSQKHQKYLIALDGILVEDPFRSDFQKNRKLFDLMNQAPETLKKKFPHLLSEEKFYEKYPELSKPKKSKVGLLTSEYSQPASTEEVAKFIQIQEDLAKNSKNLNLLVELFWLSLKMPMVSTIEKGVGGIYFATNCKEKIKKANYFNPLTHHFEYTLTRFKKIDSRNLALVRQAIHQLKRSLELDPTPQRAKKDYDLLIRDIKKAWQELVRDGTFNSNDYQKLIDLLQILLAEDPFKEEFEKNPSLFSLTINAPEIFKKKYPHLLSVDNFIKKYPDSMHLKKLELYNTHSKSLVIEESNKPIRQQNKMLTTSNKITQGFYFPIGERQFCFHILKLIHSNTDLNSFPLPAFYKFF